MKAIFMIPSSARYPRFQGEGRIDFVEKPVRSPGSGQLLVQVKANALCGSERGQYFHGSGITPGHEAAGIVIAAGPDTSTPVGTPGVIFLMDFCGECRSCVRGFTNQCLHKRADMGFSHDGGYGPYELIHENIFFPIDSDLSLTDATLLLDIMGTGGHALQRAGLVHPDPQSLLVTGAGPIGLGVLAMAKLRFGKTFPVFIADYVPYRLQLAERLGGLPIALSEGTLEEGLKRHGSERADLAVDTSGKGAARQAALELLDQRGALVCVGHGEGLNLEVSRQLIAPERAILGSEYFAYGELNGNLELLRSHRDYLSAIITHRFGVEELRPAFEIFFGGETGKVVIEQ
jgi:threonine dehydrogenase-like Zn-dependent dehydrogenase